jgi:hypothetical protein
MVGVVLSDELFKLSGQPVAGVAETLKGRPYSFSAAAVFSTVGVDSLDNGSQVGVLERHGVVQDGVVPQGLPVGEGVEGAEERIVRKPELLS